MKDSYYYYQDPGHGWVAVPLKDIDSLGIRHLISGYSYQKGNTVYLEEDCDASVFFKAYEMKNGKKPVFVSRHTNGSSPIRSYPGFKVVENYDSEGYRKYLYGEKVAV